MPDLTGHTLSIKLHCYLVSPQNIFPKVLASSRCFSANVRPGFVGFYFGQL